MAYSINHVKMKNMYKLPFENSEVFMPMTDIAFSSKTIQRNQAIEKQGR